MIGLVILTHEFTDAMYRIYGEHENNYILNKVFPKGGTWALLGPLGPPMGPVLGP